jgi:hypothetical protein
VRLSAASYTVDQNSTSFKVRLIGAKTTVTLWILDAAS